MNQEFRRIIAEYNFSALEDELVSSKKVENIFIGVLGEFSSGKSSLLNSILGKKILPAMDKTTTKSITYLKSDLEQVAEFEYFEISEDDTEKKISLLDFQDIAKGNRSGEAVVSVKSNDFLNKGYVFVDTPGVSSLDQTEIDITYGLLPQLDGILICIDCNTGSLNSSIKSFLETPEIDLMKDKILFVLTKSDQKTTDSMNKIIEGFKIDINKYLNLHDIENRIISFSSNDVLEEGQSSEIEKLLNIFDLSINSKWEQMITHRIKKSEETLRKKIVQSLKDLKNTLAFDESQFKTERLNLEADIKSLNADKDSLKSKLDKFESFLYDEIKSANKNISSQIENECSKLTPNEDLLKDLYQQYIIGIEKKLDLSISKFFKDFNLIKPTNLNIDFDALSSNITSIIRYKEMITGAVTSVSIALATGGSSLLANAAETGATTATQVAGKTIAKEAVKEGAKQILKQNAKRLAFDFIVGLGEKAKEVNPIEHLGALISKKQIQSTLFISLSEIGRNICHQTVLSIEEQIDLVFGEIDEKLDLHESNLDTAYDHAKKGKREIEDLKFKIDQEIDLLS